MADIRKKNDRAYLVRWRENGRQRYRQFRTEAEAIDFKREVEGRQRTARVLAETPGIPGWDRDEPLAAEDPSTSVAGYARAMLDADRDLRPTTRALYERTIRDHLDSTALGATDIMHVRPSDLAEWWDGLTNKKTGEPAGTGVRRNAQQLLARIFNRAVLVGDLEASPLKRTPEIRRPRSAKAGRALTLDQLERLADAAAGGPGDRAEQVRARDRLVVLIMGFGGLRAGEVGALRLDDVERNGKRCRLRVLRAVVRETGSEPYISELKTAAGRRTVLIPCSIADELLAYVERYGIEGTLLTKADGSLLARNDISYIVRSAAKRAGIPDVHAHGLRHTAASLAVAAGANPEALRAMLGHADVRLTLSTYTHLFDWGAEDRRGPDGAAPGGASVLTVAADRRPFPSYDAAMRWLLDAAKSALGRDEIVKNLVWVGLTVLGTWVIKRIGRLSWADYALLLAIALVFLAAFLVSRKVNRPRREPAALSLREDEDSVGAGSGNRSVAARALAEQRWRR